MTGHAPTFLVFGYGTMAGAMVDGWLAAGMPPTAITAYNPRAKPVPQGVRLLTQLPHQRFDYVLLGIKPQLLGAVADQVDAAAGRGSVVLSLLAGVDLASLERALPSASGWVRWMPNLAAARGKSANLLAAAGLTAAQRAQIDGLARMIGSAEWLADERQFDLATAVAGCGPAFLYRFIDALGAAAEAEGLDGALAARLALQAVAGGAALAEAAEQSPAQLADRVASAGGMTRAGLDVLDEGRALELLLAETLSASKARATALCEAAAKSD